jgi:hypothetical protein
MLMQGAATRPMMMLVLVTVVMVRVVVLVVGHDAPLGFVTRLTSPSAPSVYPVDGDRRTPNPSTSIVALDRYQRTISPSTRVEDG